MAWYREPRGAIAVAVVVTLLALVENFFAPWAPFYAIYALVITTLPLVWRTPRFARPRARSWLLAIVCGLGMQLVAGGWEAGVFRPLVRASGVDAAALDTPFWSFGAALAAVFEPVGSRWHTDPARLLGIYIACIVAWAAFGEEVFYRGYLHEILSRRHRLVTTTVIASAFFAVRHATQLVLVGPRYPWGAAVSWMVIAGLFGAVCSLLYARTRSLWPPILAHYVFNLVPAIAGIAASGSGTP
jgi:membrane protease YdiL (CAAX protease family)